MDMRGIKVGNFLMYRNSQICLVREIISTDNGAPACIVGIDSNNNICKGPATEWTSVIGKADRLRSFSDKVLDNIIRLKRVKAKG